MHHNNRSIQTALIQQRCGETPQDNLRHAIRQIEVAADRGAQLVVLQELHNSRYFCQTQETRWFDLAEPVPGPSTEQLAEVAARSGVVVVASLFERRARGLFHNTAAVIDSDGTLAGTYRKMHVPQDPGFEEKFYFTPGDLGFKPVDTSVGRLGVLICWDQWFPEAARLLTMQGADLLIYPTAIGWDPNDDDAERARQLDAWITVQRGHAIANGIHLLACNRTGFEPSISGTGIEFWGNSFVAGPQGELLAQASAGDETILQCEVDLARTDAVRRIWPFLRDRRIDAYDGLVKRYLDGD
jgi:N-carbamoylputrescine amidase